MELLAVDLAHEEKKRNARQIKVTRPMAANPVHCLNLVERVYAEVLKTYGEEADVYLGYAAITAVKAEVEGFGSSDDLQPIAELLFACFESRYAVELTSTAHGHRYCVDAAA